MGPVYKSAPWSTRARLKVGCPEEVPGGWGGLMTTSLTRLGRQPLQQKPGYGNCILLIRLLSDGP